jgi:hypothetical protein
MTNNDRKRLAAVAEMRTWIHTPFRHQGRMKGSGVDCIGLCLAAAHAIGAISPEQEREIPNYHRLPRHEEMRAFLEKHLRRITYAEAKPLDIVLVPLLGRSMHLGLLTDFGKHGTVEPPFGLLHAMAIKEAVLEQGPFDPKTFTVRGYYRFPELDEDG